MLGNTCSRAGFGWFIYPQGMETGQGTQHVRNILDWIYFPGVKLKAKSILHFLIYWNGRKCFDGKIFKDIWCTVAKHQKRLSCIAWTAWIWDVSILYSVWGISMWILKSRVRYSLCPTFSEEKTKSIFNAECSLGVQAGCMLGLK